MCYIKKLEDRIKIKYPTVHIEDFSVYELGQLDDMRPMPKTVEKTTSTENEES